MSNKENLPVGGTIVLLLVFVNALIMKSAFIENSSLYNSLYITIPLLIIAIYDFRRDKKVIVKNFGATVNASKSADESLDLSKHKRSESPTLVTEE